MYTKKKRLSQLSLSDPTKAIILGTLLGDGSLQWTTGAQRNAQLSIHHSEVQREYFLWKATMLEEIASLKSIQEQSPQKSSFSQKSKLLFQSRAHEDLSVIYEILYPKKGLQIRRRWLNHLTPLSLAIWWCDDGSIIGSPSRRGVLCTDDFDHESVLLLARYLWKVWGIRVHVGAQRRRLANTSNSSKKYYRLWFSTEELKKWLRLIMPYIPIGSMVYKCILVYKDSQFQQRWISEVKEALPQFHQEIDQALLRKRPVENDIVQ